MQNGSQGITPLPPKPLLKIFNTNGGQKVQRYPTRNKHILNIQRHQDIRFNKSFLCRSIEEFGHLPDYLKKEKILLNLINIEKVYSCIMSLQALHILLHYLILWSCLLACQIVLRYLTNCYRNHERFKCNGVINYEKA